MAGVCTLCLSPYREEIKRAYGNGFKHRTVFEKYSPLMKYKGDFLAWKQMVWRHKDHNYSGVTLLPADAAGRKAKATLETLVEGLTELGMRKLETASPENTSWSDIFKGHQTQIAARKLKLGEDAMAAVIGKMFGPPIKGEVVDAVVEGETHELPGPGRAEDGTAQPGNTQ